MTYARVAAEVNANTASILANADVLASDFSIVRGDNLVRVAVVPAGTVTVRLSPSTGTGFLLNGGTAITGGTVHVEELPLDSARTWNIQPVSGASVFNYVRVLEVASR